jgi:DNA-binding response OmpR family regulator
MVNVIRNEIKLEESPRMKKNRLILAVDDDEEMLRMLNRIFELEGYDVEVAADGKTGLSLLDETNPDLIILDIMMPGLNGFEVLDLIRQRSTVPVIMLTARCEVSTLRDALVLGADDYVRKPFSTHEVVARVRAKLRRTEKELHN